MAKINRKLSLERQKLVQSYLSHCIAHMQPGEHLPSIREMIHVTGTSRSAVMQALDYYKNLNMIAVKPRSGIVKCGGAKTSERIIDIIACHETGYFSTHDTHGFFHELLASLHAIASERRYALRMHRVRNDNANAIGKYMNIRELNDSAGYILLMPRIRELVCFFEATGKPVVCAFPQPKLRGARQVIDSPRLMSMAVEHLVANGHRRIAYLTGFEDEWLESMTAYERRMEYYRLMAEHGFPVDPCWLQGNCETPAGVEQALGVLFASLSPPTALIVMNYMSHLYSLLDKFGYRPGRNMSVIAIDCMQDWERSLEGTAIIRNSREEAAEMIWQLLEEQWHGATRPCLHEAPLELVPGNSIVNLTP